MDIVVLVKQVADVELNIRVQNDAIVEDGLNYVISNWDEVAIEAALQITEQSGGEVTLVSIGPDRAVDALRKGLAMGAHNAVHVCDAAFDGSDSFVYAKAIAKVLEGRRYDLVLAGKQAQDTDAGLTAGMLAELLDVPQVSNVVHIDSMDASSFQVQRKADHGNEVVALQLPAVLTVNDSLYEPRLAALRGIMQAKKKPLETLDAAALGMSASDVGSEGAQTQVLAFAEPEARQAGQKFEGDEEETTQQVVELLINEAKLFA